MENQGQALRSAHGSRHTEGEEESVKEQRGLVSAALGRNADHRGRGSTQSQPQVPPRDKYFLNGSCGRNEWGYTAGLQRENALKEIGRAHV